MLATVSSQSRNAFVTTAELAAQPGKRRRQLPALERRTVPQRARLRHQHRQIMPGIVDRPVAPEEARMFGDDLVAHAHDDPVGIGAPGCGSHVRLRSCQGRCRILRWFLIALKFYLGIGHGDPAKILHRLRGRVRPGLIAGRDPGTLFLVVTAARSHPSGCRRRCAAMSRRRRHRQAGLVPPAAPHRRDADARRRRRYEPPKAGHIDRGHWSLIDNFEWISGYKAQFGLHNVDRTTFARMAKPNASVYAAIVGRNAV
jgi:hypothetical protein